MIVPDQNTRWFVAPRKPEAETLARETGCPPLTAHILQQRGIETASEIMAYLHPSYDHLADPALLPDADLAVRRLRKALEQEEIIYVHGDYDSDGITSAALWTRLLEMLGGRVLTHVPHRLRDGYDVRSGFIETARTAGAALIVTADCGSQRHEEAAAAARSGIDVLITDHHEVGRTLPKAVAVVNPQRADSKYPFRHLSGVGVSFRLLELLVRDLALPVGKYRDAFVELAAIGTITDVMPLLGENRVIAKAGLSAMGSTRRRGLRALMRVAGLADAKPVASSDIGFMIGPRINAIGRIDEPSKALELLLTRDDATAQALAVELDQANRDRREQEAAILADAIRLIEDAHSHPTPCIVLAAPGWHRGIIGIVANRLVERYYRPTALISTDPETGIGRGSCRSIPCFNIHEALLECSDYLIEFGGHAHAAGFSIAADAIPSFREALNKAAMERLNPEDLVPSVAIDAEIALADLDRQLLQTFADMEPFGHGNDEPRLGTFGVPVRSSRRIGKDGAHLRLELGSRSDPPTSAVMWHRGDWADRISPNSRIDLCYHIRPDHYRGPERIQLRLLAVRPAADHPRKELSR